MRWNIPTPHTLGKKITLSIVLFILIGGGVWFASALPAFHEKEDCSVMQKNSGSSTVRSCAPQDHPLDQDHEMKQPQ